MKMKHYTWLLTTFAHFVLVLYGQ